MDKLSSVRRSLNMSKIKSINTKPEILIRKSLYNLGFRYRIHNRNLPGKPDIVFNKYNLVIFINGCFWHLHKNCKEGRIPKTRTEFWKEKLHSNVERDKQNLKKLNKLGFKTIVVWECEIEKDIDKIVSKIFSLINDKKLKI